MTQLRVGFAGLGRMGAPMARQILGAGFDLTVYNRTPPTAQAFAEANTVGVARTPRELAERASVIIAMLADGPALLDLIEGPDGLAAGLTAGDVVVDMGTSGTQHTNEARQRLSEIGAALVEAPVSGSVAAVEAKSLLVMVGGDPSPIAAVLPVLDAMAANVIETGGPGTGAAMKLSVNAVLYGINQAVAESLVLAEKAGIDRSLAYEVFAASAIAAPVVHYRRAVFENPGTTPVTFSVDLATKDLALILRLAAELGTPVPQAETNHRIMSEVAASGLGDSDMGDVAVHLRG